MVIVYLLLMAIAKIYLKLPYWGVLLIAVLLINRDYKVVVKSIMLINRFAYKHNISVEDVSTERKNSLQKSGGRIC